MKKLTSLLLCVLLLCGMALANGEYTCSLCGWTGIAGNFCGGCGERQIKETAAQSVEVGDIVTFGHYPQTAKGDDMTPIEWIVLDRDGNKALLISKYVLDSQRYNENWVNVTWETCTLRTWLNNEFINKAFSESERNAIFTTAVDNSQSQGNSEWKTNGGNNTTDQVFLLSYVEAWKYFGSDNDCKATATEYANREYSNRWWLRSPGSRQYSAAYVYYDGSRDSRNVGSTRGVRPALWVNLESGIF